MKEDLSIEPYYVNLDYLRQTAEQVKKDFEQHGFDIVFSGDPLKAYEELFIQVKPILLRLSQEDHQRFLNLLYRIDVNEKMIRSNKPTIHVTDTFDQLTDAVLKRELQKVVIRNYFKQHGDKH